MKLALLCWQWARDQFEGFFTQQVQVANDYLADPHNSLNHIRSLRGYEKVRTTSLISTCTCRSSPTALACSHFQNASTNSYILANFGAVSFCTREVCFRQHYHTNWHHLAKANNKDFNLIQNSSTASAFIVGLRVFKTPESMYIIFGNVVLS